MAICRNQEILERIIAKYHKEVIVPLGSLILDIVIEDIETSCERCRNEFFNGCPHCGNTFLKREILRQTA